MIEHSAIVTTGDTLKVPMLDDVAVVAAAAPPRQTLADSERDLIVQALESTALAHQGADWRGRGAGPRPSTLYSRMKKLGIRPHGPEVGRAWTGPRRPRTKWRLRVDISSLLPRAQRRGCRYEHSRTQTCQSLRPG